MTTYSLAELMAMPPRRSDWGPWRLDAEHLVLFLPSDWNDADDHAQGFIYYVDLEDCRTSAAVLDWLAQVAGKSWATSEVLAGLVRAIDDVLPLQSLLCGSCLSGGGLGRTIAKDVVRKRVGEVAKWAA